MIKKTTMLSIALCLFSQTHGSTKLQKKIDKAKDEVARLIFSIGKNGPTSTLNRELGDARTKLDALLKQPQQQKSPQLHQKNDKSRRGRSQRKTLLGFQRRKNGKGHAKKGPSRRIAPKPLPCQTLQAQHRQAVRAVKLNGRWC